MSRLPALMEEDMDLTRRGALSLAAFGAVATMLPIRTWAETNGWEEAVSAFTGGADVAEGGVTLDRAVST